MGGAALGRQAKILTTAHLELLIRHCQTSLASLFPDTRPLLAFAEKETHGDLDLLVAYEVPFDPKAVKGEEFGLLDDEGKNLGPAPWHPVQGGRKDKGLGKEGAENEAFRQWAEGVSLGFFVNFNDSGEWSGAEESKTKKGARKFEKEPFYQVDLQFISPDHMSFTHFFRSYSNILLSHLVTLLSPHLRASGTHLSFHYSPYPGIGPIKIELTSDPDDFCEWLGLDYARFLQGFETRKDLWQWVTTVKDGGKAQRVWTGLVRRYKERPDNGIVIERVSLQWKSRNPGWTYFLEWLRLSDESPFSRVQPRPREVEQARMAAMATTAAEVPIPETPMAEVTAETGGLVGCTATVSSTMAMTEAIASAMSLPETPAAEDRSPPMPCPSPADAAIVKVDHSPSVSKPNDEIPENFRAPRSETMSVSATVHQAASRVETPAAEKRESPTLAASLAGLSLASPAGVLSTNDEVPEAFKDPQAGSTWAADQPSAIPASSLFQAAPDPVPLTPTVRSKDMSDPVTDKEAAPTATSVAPAPAKSQSSDQGQILDPDHPADLCPTAREALERWHMVRAFEELMKVKKEEAETMIAARLANAEEKAREKAELEAEAKEKALASGGAVTDILEGQLLDGAARQSPPADTAAASAIVAKGLMVDDGCDDKAEETKP